MFQRKTIVSVLLSGALALPAFAQEAAPPAPAPAAQPPPVAVDQIGIEEITITARKVTENLQETPLSVSAISSESLESMGIFDTRDITAIAPNAYFTQTPGSAANLALAVRGVGGAEPALTREQGVAIYMDGAYVARVTGAIMDLVDVERVEVLRGPQGTLYGRNATGGAVNFISRRPTEEFEFTQRIGVGSFGRFESLTRINTGEMLPGLSAAVSYLHRQRDGYIDNSLADDNSDPNATNTDAFRIALGWDITEKLRADYAFDYEDLEGMSPAFQLFVVDDDINFGAGDFLGFPSGFANQLDVSKNQIDELNLDFDAPSEHLIRGHNLTLEYDFGPVQLKSITTYRDWENSEHGTELDGNVTSLAGVSVYSASILPFDPLGLPLGFACGPFPYAACLVNPQPAIGQLFAATNERHQDQWTQEIQVLGSVGDSLDYVAGFYYFTEEYDEANIQQFLIPLGAIGGVAQLATPLVYEGDASAWALFANSTYTLPFLDERISITGGIRYSQDEKNFVKQNLRCLNPTNLPPCETTGPTTTPGFGPTTANGDQWDSVDWEVTAKFAVTESINTYARVATGYKAGGFNIRTSQPTIAPFNEEDLIQYEIGMKSRFWEDRLQLNVAAFFSDYTDIQTDVFAAGPAGATSITVNGGKAEIPGVELEFIAEPLEGVRLNLNYGWINPEFKEYAVVDNNGTTVTCSFLTPVGYPCMPDPTVDDFDVDLADQAEWGYRPDQTLSAGAEYSTPPLGGMGIVLTARIDVRWTDQLLWSPLDDERPTLILNPGPSYTAYRDLLIQKAYTLVDARLTVSEISLGESKIRAAVFGKNITGEEYLMSGIDFGGLGFAGGIFGEPAIWGIDVTLDY